MKVVYETKIESIFRTTFDITTTLVFLLTHNPPGFSLHGNKSLPSQTEVKLSQTHQNRLQGTVHPRSGFKRQRQNGSTCGRVHTREAGDFVPVVAVPTVAVGGREEKAVVVGPPPSSNGPGPPVLTTRNKRRGLGVDGPTEAGQAPGALLPCGDVVARPRLTVDAVAATVLGTVGAAGDGDGEGPQTTGPDGGVLREVGRGSPRRVLTRETPKLPFGVVPYTLRLYLGRPPGVDQDEGPGSPGTLGCV